MSKKISVQTKDYRYDVEDVGGTIYVHKTYTPPPDALKRGVQTYQPTETIFTGSDEEVNYIASAIRTVTGRDQSLQPKEKIVTPEST
jgi:hypothetical protein